MNEPKCQQKKENRLESCLATQTDDCNWSEISSRALQKPTRCGFRSFLTSAADFEDRFSRVSKITVFFWRSSVCKSLSVHGDLFSKAFKI